MSPPHLWSWLPLHQPQFEMALQLEQLVAWHRLSGVEDEVKLPTDDTAAPIVMTMRMISTTHASKPARAIRPQHRAPLLLWLQLQAAQKRSGGNNHHPRQHSVIAIESAAGS